MTILVVEANTTERYAIVEALADIEDVAVLGAVPGVGSALHALADARPDVVITSAELPDGSGSEIVSAVRRQRESPAIVVIDRDATRERWLRHLADGADRVVDRDRDLAELRYIVRQLADATRRAARRATWLRRIDLRDVVGATFADILPMVPAGVSVDLDLQNFVLPIFGVPAEVEMLITTVLHDAAQSVQAGGSLRMRVRRTAAAATLFELVAHGRDYATAIADSSAVFELARRQRAAIKVVGRDDGSTVVTIIFPADTASH